MRKALCKLLGWPKILFRFFHNMLQKSPNEVFDQTNTLAVGTTQF